MDRLANEGVASKTFTFDDRCSIRNAQQCTY